MDVKPWEPVRGWFVSENQPLPEERFWNFSPPMFEFIPESSSLKNKGRCLVILANGQRIIVRALSEERKAARRERQDANR